MKSFLVIGLGRFGSYLASKLTELGDEVLVLDQNEERVARMASVVTAASTGDCRDEQVLAALGVRNFDACFVCVSDDFLTSLEATAALKELGAKCVVARADREKQIKFLKKIGADYVIHTEMDMAWRVAMRFSTQNVFEYFELTPQYAVFEMETPREWVGRTVAQVDVRRRYNVNILGVKVGDELEPLLDPEYCFQADTHLFVAGDKERSRHLIMTTV